MDVTFFISGVTGGGAEKVCCAISSYLVGRGHNVELLTMCDEAPTYPLDSRVSRYALLKKSERTYFIFDNVLRLVRLFRYLINKKSGVYVVMLPTNIITMLSLKFLTPLKVIAAERANPSSYKRIIQKSLLLTCAIADGWVYQTSEQKAWYHDHIGSAKSIIIPNAINPDIDNFQCKGLRDKVIVTAGRLTEQKNHILLIEAFTRLADKYEDYKLIIYGEGPMKDVLIDKISHHKLEHRILLAGYSTNMLADVSRASLFVLSSNYEGMPNALMEAMALGVPCISTDCDGGGARFLINHEKNGLLIPAKDIDALVSAIDRLLSDNMFAESLGDESRKIRDILSADVIYNQWENFLEEVYCT